MKGDIFKLPIKNNYYDITFNGGTIEHYELEDSIKLVKKMKKVTKKGGYVIVYVPNLFNIQLIIYRLRIIFGIEKNIVGIPNEKLHTYKSLEKIFIESGFNKSDIIIKSTEHIFPHFFPISIMDKLNFIERILSKYIGFFHIVIAKNI